MSVELAPQHKAGLTLDHPLLLANCTAELLALHERSLLGAVVAPELGGRQRRRRWVGERPGGLLVEEGPGAFSWSGLRQLLQTASGLPVLGRVAARAPQGAARMAARLQDEGVQGLQVDLPPGDPDLAEEALGAIRRACDLPLLVQVPLFEAVAYVQVSQAAGADALVVAGPPLGLAVSGEAEAPCTVEVHGPLLHPLFLLAVGQVAQAVSLPIVARGGLLSAADARAFLAQGAVAIMADSLAFVDPAAVSALGRELAQT